MRPYYPVAFILSLGWFGVLLVPSATRAWLLVPGDVTPNLLAIVATGLLTAYLFRRWITSARSLGDHLVRGLLIPWGAFLIYITLYNIYAASIDFLNVGRVNVHDSAVLYYWGFLYAVLAAYVILPYGVFCQWLLSKSTITGGWRRWRKPSAFGQ